MKSLVPRNYSSENGKFPISTPDDDRPPIASFAVVVRPFSVQSCVSFMRIHFGLDELHVGASRFVSTNVRRPVVVSPEPVS